MGYETWATGFSFGDDSCFMEDMRYEERDMRSRCALRARLLFYAAEGGEARSTDYKKCRAALRLKV